MLKSKLRDLFPAHILLMIICVMVLSVIMQIDNASVSTREHGLMKVLIYLLGAFISVHFILKALWIYLSGKTSSFEPSENNAKNEASSKNFAERAAPCGYKLEVSLEKGFSFCYPENWQVVR